MPTTVSSKPQSVKSNLRGMLTQNMCALKPEFAELSKADFKKEIVRRYKNEIVNCGLIHIRLKLNRESRHLFDKLELKLKMVVGPLDIDFGAFKRAKRNVSNLFIPGSIIKLKKNTPIDQLETLFKGIYSATDVSPRERRELQTSVKHSFYETIALVDHCISLRYPEAHREVFDWFLDENVFKYENLLKHLRQSHSIKNAQSQIDRDTFMRSYRNNSRHLWSR